MCIRGNIALAASNGRSGSQQDSQDGGKIAAWPAAVPISGPRNRPTVAATSVLVHTPQPWYWSHPDRKLDVSGRLPNRDPRTPKLLFVKVKVQTANIP